MDIKGTIRFTEEGFVLKPYGGEQESWFKSSLVGDSYILLDGFKYRPSSFKVKQLPSEESSEEEE
jgi:hypothetical protein